MTDKPAAAEPTKFGMSFREFLEGVHPSVKKPIRDLWYVQRYASGGFNNRLNKPPLRLHCDVCDGEHWFRSAGETGIENESPYTTYVSYRCSDCQKQHKLYALLLWIEEDDRGHVYKYGESPQFGVPVPNKVLKLFGGEDAENFKKGRRCESQGLGIAAFAYYRRVVEKHRNEIFDEIIKVCKTLGGEADLIAELEEAKLERRFTASIEKIKAALPQGLLINGQNPLLALHRALSAGLHNESDASCLQAARDVRVVLADLVEKMSMLRQDNTELSSAMQRLLQRKAEADKKSGD